MADTIGRAMEQIVYCVKETTRGTIAFPSDATTKVICGAAVIEQTPNYTPSDDVQNTLDLIDEFKDQMPPGTWSFDTYLRPSGTAGTAPMARAVLEAHYGVETVGGSDVTYSQATSKPSFSMWMQHGHTIKWARGCASTSLATDLSSTGAVKLSFSGECMEMGWAGTGEVNGIVTDSPTVVLAAGDGKKYTAKSRVMFAADDNSGAGYVISSISTDTLTMAENVTVADEAVIKGYIPDDATTAAAVENLDTSLTVDSVATTFKTITVNYGSPVAFQSTENTGTGFAEEYVEDKRTIDTTAEIVYRQDDATYLRDAVTNETVPIVITMGTTAGKIATLNLPTTNITAFTEGVDGPAMSGSLTMKSRGTSAGENSSTLVFT